VLAKRPSGNKTRRPALPATTLTGSERQKKKAPERKGEGKATFKPSKMIQNNVKSAVNEEAMDDQQALRAAIQATAVCMKTKSPSLTCHSIFSVIKREQKTSVLPVRERTRIRFEQQSQWPKLQGLSHLCRIRLESRTLSFSRLVD